jgi:hypothetical protein
MREIRSYGSQGGETVTPSFLPLFLRRPSGTNPTAYSCPSIRTGADLWVRLRACAPGYQMSPLSGAPSEATVSRMQQPTRCNQSAEQYCTCPYFGAVTAGLPAHRQAGGPCNDSTLRETGAAVPVNWNDLLGTTPLFLYL